MARTPPPKPCIVVDTREQTPWSFDPDRVDTVVGTLRTGDYSLAGHTDDVAIERKSLDDLVGSLIQGRERFERELERLRTFTLRAVIVEGSYLDIASHRYVSRAHPSAVFGSICCLHVDFSVPFLLADTRAIGARVAQRMLIRYAENIAKVTT